MSDAEAKILLGLVSLFGAGNIYFLKKFFDKFERVAEQVMTIGFDVVSLKQDNARLREEQLYLRRKYEDIEGFLRELGYRIREDIRPKPER